MANSSNFDINKNKNDALPDIPYPQSAKHNYKYGESATSRILSHKQYQRPWIGDEDGAYVWPGGLENFSYTGSATLGIHKYLGTSEVDATIQSYDEPHITISGVIQGSYSDMVSNMNALRKQCVRRADGPGKYLYLPGWNNLRRIVVESYSFDFTAAEGTVPGINYSVACLVLGIAGSVPASNNKKPINNFLGGATGTSAKHLTFTVNAQYRTLREIASKVYKNGDRWPELLTLNKKEKWFATWKPGQKLPLVYPPNSNKPVKVIYQ